MLQLLEDDTNQSLQRIEERTKNTPQELLRQIGEIDEQVAEVAKVKDKSQHDTRQKVLDASLEALRRSVADEEKDLSQAVLGLNALMNEMGLDYDNLTKSSDAEQALIGGAEARLAAAQQALPAAKSAWWFKEAKIHNAQQAIEDAQKALADAKTKAAQMARQRIMKASMSDSMQEFLLKVNRTIGIMEARKKAIEVQIETVTARKKEAFRVKEGASQKLEELNLKLNQQETQLKQEEEAQTGLVNGSPEYVAQERKVSDLRHEVEATRGSRNNALVLFQSKERFATELEIHEKAQMKLRDNQRSWITLLKSDTQERVVTFNSRLEAMKAMSDQDVAQSLDKVGVEMDARNSEFMASVGSASDKARMGMIENQPERVKRISKALAAQAEAQQLIREREQQVIEDFRRKYGIDPLDSSFFTYQTKEVAPADEPAAVGSQS
jgi:hypothetical protein